MGKQAKALWAGAVAFIAPAAALVIANGGTMTGKDWMVAGATCITVYSVTWLAPRNKV